MRLCPPASVACTMTASTPPTTASRASCSEPTCIHALMPASRRRRRERLRGIVPEAADHLNPLLITDIQLRLLGGLEHGQRCQTRAEWEGLVDPRELVFGQLEVAGSCVF